MPSPNKQPATPAHSNWRLGLSYSIRKPWWQLGITSILIILPPLIIWIIGDRLLDSLAATASSTFLVSMIFSWAAFLANIAQFAGYSLRDIWKTDAPFNISRVGFVLIVECILLLGLLVTQHSRIEALWNRVHQQNRVVILVAEFSEGASLTVPPDRSVTQTITDALRQLGETDPRLVVLSYSEPVIDQETARRIGNVQAASAVIWGTYSRSATHVLVEPHLELISGPVRIISEGYLTGPQKRLLNVTDFDSFRLHFQLSDELKYWSACVAGLAHYWKDNFTMALADLDLALEFAKEGRDQPSTAIILYYKGKIQRKQGDFSSAEESLLKSIAVDPNFPPSHNALGLTFLGQNRLEEAANQFRLAIESDPEFAPAYNNLSITYQEQGQPFELTAQLLQKAVEVDPRDYVAMENLALLLRDQGMYDAAQAQLVRSLEVSLDKTHTRYLQADLHFQWAQDKWKRRNYLSAVSEGLLAFFSLPFLDQAMSVALILIAASEVYVLANKKRRDVLFTRSTEFILRGLLRILRGAKELLAGCKNGRQPHRLAPAIRTILRWEDRTAATCYYLLGNLCFFTGDEKTAMAYWRRAFYLRPSFASVPPLLIVGYTERGDLTRALHIARQAVEHQPSNVGVHVQMGDLYYLRKANRQATCLWEKAVKLDPKTVIKLRLAQLDNQEGAIHVPAHFTLGLAFKASGELQKAAVAFEMSYLATNDPTLKAMAYLEARKLQGA